MIAEEIMDEYINLHYDIDKLPLANDDSVGIMKDCA
jgi:hypothetical protein